MGSDHNFSNLFSYREQVSRTISWGHRFLFLNILLACFIGSAYVYAAPATSSFMAFFYLLVTWLGHMGFLAFVIYLVIFFPLSFIGNIRIYRIISISLASFLHTLLLCDAKLFLVIKVHASSTILGLAFSDLDFKTGLNYNFLYFAIPFVIALQFFFSRISTKGLYHRGHSLPYKVVVSVIILSFLASHCIHIWADASRYEAINALRSVYPAHYPMTARSFLINHGWLKEDGLDDNSQDSTAFVYPLSAIENAEKTPDRNIVTIYINGLSYGDINAENTPHLLLTKQSYSSYENYYLPYDNLRDNFFAASFGVTIDYRFSFLKHRLYPVTVDELHRQDYAVRLVTDMDFHLNQTDIKAITGNPRVSTEKQESVTAVFRKAQDEISSLPDSRNFAINISINKLNNLTDEKERKRTLKAIDNELSAFLAAYAESDRFDNTLIMISSALGNPAINSSDTVYNRERQHVPMIIIWPDGNLRGVSSSAICSIFDIVPTLGHEVLGINTPDAAYSMGENLMNLQNRNFVPVINDDNLLLISAESVTGYNRDGKAFISSYGKQVPVKPNLKNLVRAMRELNRFKE